MHNDEILVVYVWAYYALYCVCVITSRCTRAQAAAAKRTSWGAAVEVDAIEEQQLKRMQSGSSRLSGRNLGAYWSDHAKLVLAKDTTT